MTPNSAQKRLAKAWRDQAREGKPIRSVIPKARKEGVSTLVESLGNFLTKYCPDFRAKVVAHTEQDTIGIFALSKRMNDNMGGAATATTITHPNGSLYSCHTAGSKGAGRGDTVHFLHFSELPYCQSVAGMDRAAVVGLSNSVADEPFTFIIAEGTGAGPRGEFHRICKAVSNDKNFFFLMWNWRIIVVFIESIIYAVIYYHNTESKFVNLHNV